MRMIGLYFFVYKYNYVLLCWRVRKVSQANLAFAIESQYGLRGNSPVGFSDRIVS